MVLAVGGKMGTFYMYVCQSLKQCFISWVDLAFSSQNTQTTLQDKNKNRPNEEKCFICQLFHWALWKLKSTPIHTYTPVMGWGGKHFILLGVTWFSMISFHFQDVLRKWPPFELSTQMMQGLKGALWNRLFSQWFLNQEIEKHITRKEPGRGRNELCGVLTVPMNMKTMGAKSQRS